MADITLLCISVERHTGTTKPKDGSEPRPYDFYSGFFKDPISGKVGTFSTNVKDGKNPPVVGQEYPVHFEIYTSRDNKFQFRPHLDPTYVS